MLNIIKYDNANALEATWLDAEGNQIASIAYADTQMDLLRADALKYGGDLTEYESLIAEVEANIQPYVPPPVVIPTVVTMEQARLALFDMGLLDAVETEMAKKDKKANITWEFSPVVKRDSSLVQSVKTTLGFTEADLDNLFLLASTL